MPAENPPNYSVEKLDGSSPCSDCSNPAMLKVSVNSVTADFCKEHVWTLTAAILKSLEIEPPSHESLPHEP